jgi:hypothetical protein
MTGQVFRGRCAVCGGHFSFNPPHVPSVRAHPPPLREPVAANCVAVVNRRHVGNGLDPIVPHPDAYQRKPGP